jgi:tRNA threonylcarbamoyladenosine biosynthesis protein TsaE
MEWTFSLDNINWVAKDFWKAVQNKTVVAFHGEMCAGKTTFIHAICKSWCREDIFLKRCLLLN